MSHHLAVQSIAAAAQPERAEPLTPQMALNATRLLARANPATGWQEIPLTDLGDLLGVQARGTLRKYLATLRAAGLIDYTLGRQTAAIWFLAWQQTAPPQDRHAPPAGRNRSPGGAQPANGAAGRAAPWAPIRPATGS